MTLTVCKPTSSKLIKLHGVSTGSMKRRSNTHGLETTKSWQKEQKQLCKNKKTGWQLNGTVWKQCIRKPQYILMCLPKFSLTSKTITITVKSYKYCLSLKFRFLLTRLKANGDVEG